VNFKIRIIDLRFRLLTMRLPRMFCVAPVPLKQRCLFIVSSAHCASAKVIL